MPIHYEKNPTGRDEHVRARVVVLAASSCESSRILLNSRSSQFPQGLANSSGVVGKYLTDTTGTFQTEMVAMSLTGFGGIRVRESPSLPSLGQTRITDIGGGMYHIDSFFDVFTELSADGGQGWLPAGTSLRMTTIDRAPTAVLPGSWGTVKVLHR